MLRVGFGRDLMIAANSLLGEVDRLKAALGSIPRHAIGGTRKWKRKTQRKSLERSR